jgi:hypothetical protein
LNLNSSIIFVDRSVFCVKLVVLAC